jgi:hypothetical protein
MSTPLEQGPQSFIREAREHLHWFESELIKSLSPESGETERLAIASAKRELEDIIRAAMSLSNGGHNSHEKTLEQYFNRPVPPFGAALSLSPRFE